MKGDQNKILYIGKAINLKRRVSSYFLRPHDSRIQKLVSEIRKIDYKKTESALEALILEAKLIKELQPPYNIREKDDKSFSCVEITKEEFPRVILVRAKNVDLRKKNIYGPFLSGGTIREALKIIRRIFPFSTHDLSRKSPEPSRRACFDYELGLCPGTCVGAITREDYAKNIQNIRLIFQGKKKRIISSLKREMKISAKNLDFEKAERIKRQIFSLEHIRDVSLISEDFMQDSIRNSKLKISLPGQGNSRRIEGYDVSNISGTSAVGGMVVFTNGKPDKKEYRKFKIRDVIGANDVGMMEEILRRRLENKWPKPNLILVDGGLAQVNVAEAVLKEFKLNIPVVGIAKGPERKRNDLIGKLPEGYDLRTLIKVRDEAHRFAISYHRKVRERIFMK